jgi:hypothetical protein
MAGAVAEEAHNGTRVVEKRAASKFGNTQRVLRSISSQRVLRSISYV